MRQGSYGLGTTLCGFQAGPKKVSNLSSGRCSEAIRTGGEKYLAQAEPLAIKVFAERYVCQAYLDHDKKSLLLVMRSEFTRLAGPCP